MPDSGWPNFESLAGIQQQCVMLSHGVSEQPYAVHRQVKKLCRTLLCILHTSSELQVNFPF